MDFTNILMLRRAGSALKSRQSIIIGLVGAVAFLFAFTGLDNCAHDAASAACKNVGTLYARIMTAIHIVTTPGGSLAFGTDPWQVVVGQYAIPEMAVAASVLAAVQLWIANFRRDWRLVMARHQSDHVIVCGLGDTGMNVIQNLRKAGRNVVAIERNAESPHALACEADKIPVLRGNAGDAILLGLAGLSRARSVVACTGDDARNIDIALRVKEVGQRRRGAASTRLDVLAEMRSDWLFSTLTNHDKHTLGSEGVDIRLFNTYQNTARVLIQDLNAATAGAEGAFVIIGFGSMGREIAVHLIRGAMVPLGAKSRIIVFDRDADQKQARFDAQYPAAKDFADLTFVAADVNAETPETWATIADGLKDEVLRCVVVCLPDDQASLFAALELRGLLDRRKGHAIPVFMRTQYLRRFGEFAAKAENNGPNTGRLRIFGAIEDHLQADMITGASLDALAIRYHEHYRRHSKNGPADRPWEELPESFKTSNRQAADHIPIKLAQIGLPMIKAKSADTTALTDDEIERLAQIEHRRWTIERRFLGWEYGDTRDDSRRLHTALVDWAELPEPMREQNRKSVAVLPAILAEAGYQITRAGADKKDA